MPKKRVHPSGTEHVSYKHGHCQISHGHNKKTRLYVTWLRLFSKQQRGEVCQRWYDFRNFLEDMDERPEGWYMARKDYSKPHGPGNNYWTQRKVSLPQGEKHEKVWFEGKQYYLYQLARQHNLRLSLVKQRLDRGWSLFRALLKEPEAPDKRPPLEYYGHLITLPQAVIISGLPRTTLVNRIEKWGWTVEEALNNKAWQGGKFKNGVKQETQTASSDQQSGGVLLLPRVEGGRPPDVASDVCADGPDGESVHGEAA